MISPEPSQKHMHVICVYVLALLEEEEKVERVLSSILPYAGSRTTQRRTRDFKGGGWRTGGGGGRQILNVTDYVRHESIAHFLVFFIICQLFRLSFNNPIIIIPHADFCPFCFAYCM